MGAVVEQIQQTYELQVNGYYSQLHLVEDYILKEKEVSPERSWKQASISSGKWKSNDSRWNEDAD